MSLSRAATWVIACVLCIASLVAAQATTAPAVRTHGGRYTAEKLASVRANVEKYDWARKLRDDAVRAADPWLKKSDDELWHMVPGQDLPRTIDVTLDRSKKGVARRVGCIVCGEKIFAFGNYPWLVDYDAAPWKVTCPSCRTQFPTNDFGKYYASGLNEHGLFDPKRADRSLLFNTAHPDPKDPLHMWGVDDGFGYIDADGHGHRYLGFYVWKYWRNLFDGLKSLSNAYVYTGDVRYARKSALLLDRIADVYPDMDWRPYARMGWFHSDGNRIAGKIEGAIWETQTATNLAECYDRIVSGTIDDAELFAFLREKSERYKLATKGSRELFVRHVDERILREIHKGILDGQISGNEGMQQRSMASAAIALNTEPETSAWLDWLFAPDGGAIPGLMLNHIDRDGASDEAAPGYAYFWGVLVHELGSLMADYPAYDRHNIWRDFPQFRSTYTVAWRMAALGRATPNLGDTGRTGLVEAASVRPDFIAAGFRRTRDPRLAVAAYRANGNSSVGLGRDIFRAEPDALSKEIESIAAPLGPQARFASDLLTGYGVAMLQSGTRDRGAAVPVYFGRTTHHAHKDTLGIDLFAFDNWLLPDQGYPEYGTSWPSRDEWTENTISHNLVVVDGQQQKTVWSGKTKLFKSLPGFSATIIDGRAAYPQTSRYERTVLLIDAPDGNHYVVDRFRVDGGDDHVYSIHGPPGETRTTGLNLVEQKQGTYAGENVAPETSPGDFPLGYSYLFNVRRDRSPTSSFSVKWLAQPGYRNVKSGDAIGVRYHGLTQVDDVALADAKPPQTKEGNPKTLPYLLLHRKDKNLASDFVSVIEPFKGEAFLKSIDCKREWAGHRLRVEHADGTVDVVALGDRGAIDFARHVGEKTPLHIAIGDDRAEPRALGGKVVSMNRDLAGGGWIVVDTALPKSVVGEHIHIDSKSDRNATYRIESISEVADGTRIDCGPITFVNGYLGPTMDVRSQIVPANYTSGYRSDFEPGDAFRIPMHAVDSQP